MLPGKYTFLFVYRCRGASIMHVFSLQCTLHYFFTFLQNSIRIVATCSRVALPCGSR